MRLVYTATNAEVKVGDCVKIDGEKHSVEYFRFPHKSSSQGKVSMSAYDGKRKMTPTEYYVSVIGAEWIEREDQR